MKIASLTTTTFTVSSRATRDERSRRQGVATAMIEALRDLAAVRGIPVVFVQADRGDEPTIALYSKLGVREDVLHFDIAPRFEGVDPAGSRVGDSAKRELPRSTR
jgi:ribosomal protein S18 acetylase RimI-like enzyme